MIIEFYVVSLPQAWPLMHVSDKPTDEQLDDAAAAMVDFLINEMAKYFPDATIIGGVSPVALPTSLTIQGSPDAQTTAMIENLLYLLQNANKPILLYASVNGMLNKK